MLFSLPDLRSRAHAASMDNPLANGGLVHGDRVIDPSLDEFQADDVRDAAVLIPVFEKDREPHVLMTVRTAHLSKHAGQVAFPGGRMDEGEFSPVITALRETEEEIGLSADYIEPIGMFAPYLSTTGYRIVPVIAEVRPGFSVAANPDEVEAIFDVPWSFLMSSGNHRKESRDWKGKTRTYYSMTWQDRYIWGVTAGIIRSLHGTLYPETSHP